jgi:SAM-dependent methyltransferase
LDALPTTYAQLKEYYGSTLKSGHDLKTGACCAGNTSLAPSIRQILQEIDGEILNRFYGCGSPIPPLLDGCTVLDLGCGSGRDAYIASKLVGQHGFVIGVDMTSEQIEVAIKHVDSMTKRYGYERPNVDFRQGYIENLKLIGIEDESVDVVISNCVINLSPNKLALFREIFRVLRTGGELYFSDIMAGRRVPERLQDNPILRGECLSGAMYIEDFRRLMRTVGCFDFRMMSKRKVSLHHPEIEALIGMVDFYSVTVRAFKLDDLEDICEDYGQVAIYQGTIPDYPHCFELDAHHRFLAGKPAPVCGNVASILQGARFSKHFTVYGDRSVHFGPFPNCASMSVNLQSEEVLYVGQACC